LYVFHIFDFCEFDELLFKYQGGCDRVMVGERCLAIGGRAGMGFEIMARPSTFGESKDVVYPRHPDVVA